MRIAILGATSQIARDLIASFSAECAHELLLFARRPDAVTEMLTPVGLSDRHRVARLTAFGTGPDYDAIINFVGAGDPLRAKEMGASVFDVTLQYDELALDYLRGRPLCRYFFLSSGAIYGGGFETPAHAGTKATIPVNDLRPEDWYGAAKMSAECRHRSLCGAAIVDIRIFNYFSRTQDLSARFLITDMVRALQAGEMFVTTAQDIVRDYLHPSDFRQLVSALLSAPPANRAIDCYSRSPVAKSELLDAMRRDFGLRVQMREIAVVNATGSKRNYFSTNRAAKEFGYAPSKTSLEGVREEVAAILSARH